MGSDRLFDLDPAHPVCRRLREQGIAAAIPCSPFKELAFSDSLLYYEGKNLLKKPFQERRELLEKIVKEQKRSIVLVQKIITENEKDIEDFFKKSIAAGNEGLMLKNLSSPYKPGARVGYMVK